MFATFLTRSLSVLEVEHPQGFAHVASLLGSREVWLEVDGERIVVCGDGTSVRTRLRGARAAAYASTTSTTLAQILNGEIHLDRALLDERILLKGQLSDLAAFYEALQAYFNVAVRCISFAALLSDYFKQVAPEGARRSLHRS